VSITAAAILRPSGSILRLRIPRLPHRAGVLYWHVRLPLHCTQLDYHNRCLILCTAGCALCTLQQLPFATTLLVYCPPAQHIFISHFGCTYRNALLVSAPPTILCAWPSGCICTRRKNKRWRTRRWYDGRRWVACAIGIRACLCCKHLHMLSPPRTKTTAYHITGYHRFVAIHSSRTRVG